MHAPRRCPVCGATHNIINYEYADSKTVFRCAKCDTEFPMLMMPAVPSSHKANKVSKGDVRSLTKLIDNPDVFWSELSKSEYMPKPKGS
jgi:hypothetical protein